jgi:hypothetical protein
MRDVYKTKSGLEIGCMYQKPLRQLNGEEEEIQSVLLGDRRSGPMSMALYAMFLVALFITLALVFGSKQ